MIKKISKDQFEAETKDNLVLLDFFAEWCGPCKMLSPVLEQVSEEMKDKVKILKIDVDEDGISPILMKFGIRSMPTLILLKDGKILDQSSGFKDKETILSWVNNFA